MQQNPPPFILIEMLPARSVGALPLSLSAIHPAVNYKAILIRLLTGTLSFKGEKRQVVVEQRNNYARAGIASNTRLSARIIRDSCSGLGTLRDLDNHLGKTIGRNTKFYRELLVEFLHYFNETNAEVHSKAFLHLYRILESMAYCFPLLWAGRAREYEKTFEQLRSYFSDPKIGELKVMKMFLKGFLDPVALYDIPMTITVQSPQLDWQTRYFKTLVESIDKDDLYGSSLNTSLDIRFGAITDLAIVLRNRYFHFLTGKGNAFSSDDIPDADEFFRCVNEVLLNWLGVVFFQILEHEVTA